MPDDALGSPLKGSRRRWGVCCVVPTRGVLKAPAHLRIRLRRELGEGDRHAAIHWLLGGQLVVPSPEVLDEGKPGNDHPGAGVLLEPPH
jgi:hypothetical protein